MGKVKTEQIKRAGKELMEKFPDKFTANFDENKRLVDTLTEGTTTPIRNKIAGYITRTVALSKHAQPMETGVEEDLSE